MIVSITSLCGRTEKYEANPKGTVKDLIKVIHENEDIDIDRIVLKWRGKHLKEFWTLESYKIQEGALLIMGLKTDEHATKDIQTTINKKILHEMETPQERRKSFDSAFQYVDDATLVSDTDDDLEAKSAKKISTMKLLAVGIIVTVIVIVIGFFFFRYEVNESIVTPTPLPSDVDDSLPINYELMEKLIYNNVSKREEFYALNSIHMDALMLLWDQNANKTNIVQQYVLALVFGGLEADRLIGSFEGISECTWNYVKCSDNMTVSSIMLGSKRLGGKVITEIALLQNLTELDLGDNNLVGTIPSSIGELTSLENINLGRNLLSGTIPESFSNLSSLVSLQVHINDLGGPLPSKIWELGELRFFDLNTNNFVGSIPNNVNGLRSLEMLDMTFLPSFHGGVPTTLGELSNLQVLQIGDNSISGTIPTEIGQLQQLRELYISYTNMQGTLPTEIGNLLNLETLVISGNMFTGSIPSEIGELIRLGYIKFEYEYLNGTIPEKLKELNELSKIIICDTDLEGKIPSEWCELGFKPISSLRCSCCKKCK